MNNETTPDSDFSGRATYEPESNKLRLYVGRVPRDEYLKLRSEGWTALHKQREAGGGDFVATWTPERRDTALEYAGIIEDEDMSMTERAADRAERFAGYREKRTDEATGHADRYDAGPSAHGFQSAARAERSARRHDRIAGRACDAWSKAEYWQQRTAGVISHALHKSSPDVRLGCFMEIESAIRKCEKSRAEYAAKHEAWTICAAMTDGDAKTALAAKLAYVEHGDYTHPRSGRKSCLYDHARAEEGRTDDPLNGAELCALWLSHHGPLAPEGDWLTHYRLRLAYENQMLEAQGGRAGAVEMVPGGWLRGGRRLGSEERQIVKVNKSNATGRVVSVLVRDNHASERNHWGNPFPDGIAKVLSHTVEIERMDPDAYRAPTAEELAKFEADEKAAKKARKASAPAAIPLINPTDADAERLQAIWNAEALAACPSYMRDKFEPSTIRRTTQAGYSANSKGTYGRAEATSICGGGEQQPTHYNYNGALGPVVCKVRTTYGNGNTSNKADSAIILTDKPQKPLPAAVWEKYTPAEAPASGGAKVLHGKSRGLSYTINA